MSHLLLEADALHLPLPDCSADLVMGSPPYTFARTYGIGAQRKCHAWVDWMLQATAEAMRVSKGLVLWVVAGQTKDWCYQPSPEGLLWRWWAEGVGSGVYLDGLELPRRLPGECHLFRPAYWHRSGISGSGGRQWLRADVEYVLAFKRPGPLPWADPTACGHPPKWAPGGAMSHREQHGIRVNTHRKTYRAGVKFITAPRANGKTEIQGYVPPKIANPGNLIHTSGGGGRLGHPLAHENEAPYPEVLAEFFVKSFCPPGGIVLDPWSGSGTTASVAARNGRVGIGSDVRRSQAELASRRIAEQLADEARPHRPKPKRKRKPKPVGQLEMFGESA